MRITTDKQQTIAYAVAYLSNGLIYEMGKNYFPDQSETFTYDLEIPETLVAVRGTYLGVTDLIGGLQFVSAVNAYDNKPVLHATPWYGMTVVAKHTFYELPQKLTPESKLISISAYYASDGITSIHCTFSNEDGTVSYVYGDDRGNATETVKISGDIRNIQVWIDVNKGVQGFRLNLSDRAIPAMFGLAQGTINEVLIPSKARFVGVYEYYNQNIVSGLGFKFALFKD